MPGLLKKIIVKNVGVLRTFNTPNSPQLEALTGFYARNGRGKTTLSSILRSAGTNDPPAILGRRTLGQDREDPEVTLIFDNGTVRFDGEQWQAPVSQIEVFDGAFIAENLHSGETVELSHDRALFRVILGRGGVKLASQQEFFVAAARRTAQRLKEAELALVDDLPNQMTLKDYDDYNPGEDLDQEIDQANKDLRRVLQGEQLLKLKKLQPITKPTLEPGISELLAKTVSEIDVSARELLAEHFKKYKLGKDGEAWVRFGIEHVHDDSCPFCGRADVDATGLITVYGQIFSSLYQVHLSAIRTMIEKVDAEFGLETRSEVSATATLNAEILASWSDYFSLGDKTLPSIAPAISLLSDAHRILKDLLDAKRQSPLTPIYDADTLLQVSGTITSVQSSITLYNNTVAELEELVEQKKQASSSLTESQARERLLNLRKRRRRMDAGVTKRIAAALSASRRDERARRIRTLVQNRLKAKNEASAKHYHGRVNYYLSKFGAKFQISKIMNSMAANIGQVDYGLIVRGHEVTRRRGRDVRAEPTFMNTLSTGDKTTLAFAFFLSQLDSLDPTILKERIIVFDDPLSSHDIHRQGMTVDILFASVERALRPSYFHMMSIF